MSSHRVPADSHVWTAHGPCRAAGVRPGDELAIVDRHGRTRRSTVTSVSPPTDDTIIELRTSLGELLLHSRAVVSARGSRMFASDAATAVLGGSTVRLEVAALEGLPTVRSRNQPVSVRAALALLSPPVVRVPARLQLHTEIDELLARAGIVRLDVSTERWTAFSFAVEGFAAPDVVSAGEASILQLVTAWATDTRGIVSRTSVEQVQLRRRLVAALHAGSSSPVVRWSPAYAPVEARVSIGPSSSFATATAALSQQRPCIELRVADDRVSIVCDRAIVSATGG